MKKFKMIFFSTLIFSLTNCSSSQESLKQKNINKDYMITEILNIEWGINNNQIHPQMIEYPLIANDVIGNKREKYSPIPFRLDSSLGIHMLENGYGFLSNKIYNSILHFNHNGEFIEKTQIPIPTSSVLHQIIDFQVDSNRNSYILESFQLKESDFFHHRLMKITSNGLIEWEVVGEYNTQQNNFKEFKGDFSKVLLDESNSNIFLTSKTELKALSQFDADNGNYLSTMDFEYGSNGVFMPKTNQLLRIIYQPESGNRGFLNFDYSNNTKKIIIGKSDILRWLLFPVGFDCKLNSYFFDDNKLAKISFEGMILATKKIENIVIDTLGKNFYYSNQKGNTMSIVGVLSNGQSQTWDLNFNQLNNSSKLKLINVDADKNFYILVSDNFVPHNNSLWSFSKDGKFLSKTPPENLNDIEISLSPYLYWQLDSLGRFYLPIITPKGVSIIRWRIFC